MFTGIVEELGAIISIDKTLAGTRMVILASAVMGDLKIGDSISVNGACLTVAIKSEHNFSVEVSPETLSVTTLGQLTAGAPLNLARWIIVTSSRTQASVPTRSACIRFRSVESCRMFSRRAMIVAPLTTSMRASCESGMRPPSCVGTSVLPIADAPARAYS